MAFGVTLVGTDGVVVIQESGDGPVEHLQNLQHGFADVHVAAHHTCQGGELDTLVHEVVYLGPGCEDWQAPHSGVPGHWGNHVVTHWPQEGIWTQTTG